MSDQPENPSRRDDNRREFIRGSSFLLASALPSATQGSAAGPIPEFRLGLIGCGRSGIGQLKQALQLDDVAVRVVALADVFPDRVQQCVRNLKGRFPDQFAVDASRRFTGLDAYEQLLGTETDLIILAASPVFRPVHLQAALKCGRSVFLLDPISADRTGAEKVVACLQAADRDGICAQIGGAELLTESMAAGLGQEIMGEVSEIFSQAPLCVEERRRRSRKESDFEFQLRNSSRHHCLTGQPTLKQHVEHVCLAQQLLGASLRSSDVMTHTMYAPGCFTSRIRLEFDNGQRLVSHCRLLPALANFQRQTRIIGSECQYDLSTDRLLSQRGNVIKRGGNAPAEGSNRLTRTIRNIVANQPHSSSALTARNHLAICQAMAEHQQACSCKMSRA